MFGNGEAADDGLSSEYKAPAEYRPTNKARFVTTALFDGHDPITNASKELK